MRRRPLPKIEPIRPVRRTTVPVGAAWLYELKLDGFRGVLSLQDGQGSFVSKNTKPMPRFRELADSVARALPVEDAILDGEIIVMTEAGPDFDALFWRRRQAGICRVRSPMARWPRSARAAVVAPETRAEKKLLDATPIPYSSRRRSFASSPPR